MYAALDNRHRHDSQPNTPHNRTPHGRSTNPMPDFQEYPDSLKIVPPKRRVPWAIALVLLLLVAGVVTAIVVTQTEKDGTSKLNLEPEVQTPSITSNPSGTQVSGPSGTPVSDPEETGAKLDPTPVPDESPACPLASDVWTPALDLPMAMGEVSAGLLTHEGKEFLLVVGEMPKADASGPEGGNSALLDITNNSWDVGWKRPYVGHHHASEVIGNKMYLFGGFRGESHNKVQIAELTADGVSWSEGERIPFGAGSANSAFINGKVHLCGGVHKSSDTTQPDCAIYDPETDTWSSEMADMALARNHAATCTDGEKMFVFGGRGPGSGTNNILADGFDDTQIFDPATNTWTATSDKAGSPAPIPEGRGGVGKAVYHEGKCYVFGGETEPKAANLAVGLTGNSVYFRTDIYTIGTNTWSRGQDMPVALHGTFAVSDGCKAYIAAGGLKAGNSQSTGLFTYTL